MDGTSAEVVAIGYENLEHFKKKSSNELKYSLLRDRLPFGETIAV